MKKTKWRSLAEPKKNRVDHKIYVVTSIKYKVDHKKKSNTP